MQGTSASGATTQCMPRQVLLGIRSITSISILPPMHDVAPVTLQDVRRNWGKNSSGSFSLACNSVPGLTITYTAGCPQSTVILYKIGVLYFYRYWTFRKDYVLRHCLKAKLQKRREVDQGRFSPPVCGRSVHRRRLQLLLSASGVADCGLDHRLHVLLYMYMYLDV